MDYEAGEVLFGKGSVLVIQLEKLNETLSQIALILEDRLND